ncbi:MAG: pyruvate kinase [Patescibacteria group bacterium]|jgi:pyruvate kinase
MKKRTKIVCTIGPSSEDKKVLESMVHAGMDVARLNFSHGKYRHHKMLIKNIRIAAARAGHAVAILQDLQGPRIRTGNIVKEGVELSVNDKVALYVEKETTAPPKVKADKFLPIQYQSLAKEIKIGATIFISDGIIELKVTKVDKKQELVFARVIRGGTVLALRGMNLPGTKISAPSITAKDKEDLKFGLCQGMDWVALSFVREASDVSALKRLIQSYHPKSLVKVMAKIERQEAIKNFDKILAVVDGIMVARGDLGIELAPAQVPILQKELVAKCLAAAKPVIVATQMLESMMEKPRPTRAEVSDVANAVIDHADAVMLSGETATGKYPVEVVEMMASIISKTEKSPYDDLAIQSPSLAKSTLFAVAESIKVLANKLKVKVLVVSDSTGEAVRAISSFRPEVDIIVLTRSKTTQQQLGLNWGVRAELKDLKAREDKLSEQMTGWIYAHKKRLGGSRAIIVSAVRRHGICEINFVKVVEF